MIALLFLALALAIAFTSVGRYKRWRDRRDMIASTSDLWAHTLPYEPAARERRQ
jgi:hypothetical protein